MFILYALKNRSRMEAGASAGKLMEQSWKEDAGMDLSEKLDEGKMKWSETQEGVATGLRGLGVRERRQGKLLVSDFSYGMVEPLQEKKRLEEKSQ